ncbi:hypothetical protein, partial [Acinetobacter soli]|uniref:hypothetical protein n=1 Tax=Acinetobacter soli TaxID=487316 RepID=UPI001C08CC27
FGAPKSVSFKLGTFRSSWSYGQRIYPDKLPSGPHIEFVQVNGRCRSEACTRMNLYFGAPKPVSFKSGTFPEQLELWPKDLPG